MLKLIREKMGKYSDLSVSVFSCRLPRHPVLNSPVVTVSMYNNHSFVEGFLESPVMLEFRLLETSNRSKPLCVQWNHTSP